MKPDERIILEECKKRLQGLKAVHGVRVGPLPQGKGLASRSTNLTLDTEVGPLSYRAVIVQWPTSATTEWLRSEAGHNLPTRWLVLAEHVSAALAIDLVNAEIDFADTAGNVVLHNPGFYIDVRVGRRPKRLRDRQTGRLFAPKGLQILFALLADEDAVSASFRELAYASGVALGSVAHVLGELRAKGFMEKRGPRAWYLARRRELLDIFVLGYAERLRPKLVIGRFRSPEPDLESTLKILRGIASQQALLWTLSGGWAADALVHHYRGEDLCLLVSGWTDQVSKALRWLPSATGPIILLRQFAPGVAFPVARSADQVAHPLLVYAELLHHGGERERETARLVFERYLARSVQEDAPR